MADEATSPDDVEARRRRAVARRRHKYGLTEETFWIWWEEQDGRCAICRREFADELDCDVDHDHETLALRGLLCRPCNLGLGAFRDNIGHLRRAIVYLRENEPERRLTRHLRQRPPDPPLEEAMWQ